MCSILLKVTKGSNGAHSSNTLVGVPEKVQRDCFSGVQDRFEEIFLTFGDDVWHDVRVCAVWQRHLQAEGVELSQVAAT